MTSKTVLFQYIRIVSFCVVLISLAQKPEKVKGFHLPGKCLVKKGIIVKGKTSGGIRMIRIQQCEKVRFAFRTISCAIAQEAQKTEVGN